MSEPLYRRILSALRVGTVNTTRDDGPVQLAQVQVSPLETRDNVVNSGWWGFASRPHPGAQVIIAVPGGSQSSGVIIASGDQRYHFALTEGECAIYDDLGQSVHLTRTGIVINGGGLPMQIENTPTLTITATTKIRAVTPRFECTGDIIDQCDTQPHTVGDFRTIYDQHTHPVPNVQSGGSTVTTNIPNQQD